MALTLTSLGPPPSGLGFDGHKLDPSRLPLRLQVAPGPHRLILGDGDDSAGLPLYLGPTRTEVFVSESSRAILVRPAASHLAPAYLKYTSRTGPAAFASFLGWLAPSRALITLPEGGSYAWDLEQATLEEIWPITASWASADGRWLAGTDEGRLVLGDLQAERDTAICSWDAEVPMGVEESAVLAGSPTGGWFGVAVYGPHDEPVWPSLGLFTPGTGLHIKVAAADLEAMAPGSLPTDRFTIGNKTLFVTRALDVTGEEPGDASGGPASPGAARLVLVTWPGGSVEVSDPIADLPERLQVCGVRDGRLVLLATPVAEGESEASLTGLWSYDPAQNALERLAFESEETVLAGAIDPVTGALWLVLEAGQVDGQAFLSRATEDWSGPGTERLDFPLSTTSVGLSWSPDGTRAMLADAYRNTCLVVVGSH